MANVESCQHSLFMAGEASLKHIWQDRVDSMQVVIDLVPRYLPDSLHILLYVLSRVSVWLKDANSIIVVIL